MPRISTLPVREIIEDFAEEINQRKIRSSKPSKTVINFRNDVIDGYEREIVKVPLGLLRYRKDNGRIASDVLDYEFTHGVLGEAEEDDQDILRGFLERKDPEKRRILYKNILHSGQRQPAIITCDGFLINGNRRKMVLEQLRADHQENDRFQYMDAVILPGRGEEGGPPTLLEIEKLENRYQLQSEGKSEYYGFDRALSIRRKIRVGLSLEDQIADDPQYANATPRDIQKATREIKKNYLDPLECVDRYLRQFQREGQYHTVSSGAGDTEGRWQAFLDYSNSYSAKFGNPKFLIEHQIDEDEIGEIEEAAFNIIRLRTVPAMPKVHQVMRSLPKYCGTSEGKKEILRIAEKVEPILPINEQFQDPEETIPLTREEIDTKWSAKYVEPITFHLKRASKNYERQKEKETPLSLLDAALKKLTHKDMDISSMSMNDFKTARELTVQIQRAAHGLEGEIYSFQKKLKKIAGNL